MVRCVGTSRSRERPANAAFRGQQPPGHDRHDDDGGEEVWVI